MEKKDLSTAKTAKPENEAIADFNIGIHKRAAVRRPLREGRPEVAGDNPSLTYESRPAVKALSESSSVKQMKGGFLATVVGVHHAVATMPAPRPVRTKVAPSGRRAVRVRCQAWVATVATGAVVVVATVLSAKKVVRAGALRDGGEANGPARLQVLGPSQKPAVGPGAIAS